MEVKFTRRTGVFLRALPWALGAAAFLTVVGPRALNPFNIAWLATGDPATHYLGWQFFRDSPWLFPVGLNPRYGLELSNAILYSDSNPLLACLFKPLSRWLPTTFQYFGLWLLACFCLQAWFAWKLVGLISASFSIRLLGAGLFVFAPPMLARLDGHFNLVGHFLIVAALYGAFHPHLKRRGLAWGALLTAAALVHGYLLAMVAPIWAADLLTRTGKKEIPWRLAMAELAALLTVLGFVCWQAGYFSVGGGTAAEGFGFFRMNLLALIDPSGWSYVLKDIPQSKGDYEGFNYLGLGVIFLLVVALPWLHSHCGALLQTVRRHQPVSLVMVGFTLFAASHNLGLGPWERAYYLPDSALQLANLLRSSGRMFWPVFYLVVLTAIGFVVRTYARRAAIALLAVAFGLQLVDTSAGWLGLRRKLMTEPLAQWSMPLQHPFWAEAASQYSKVRYIPTSNHAPHWQTLASYAAAYHLATDAVYLARVGELALKTAQEKAQDALTQSHFEPDALYVLDDAAWRTAAASVDAETTLAATIDGLPVIAPGWKSCAACRRMESASPPTAQWLAP